MIQEVVEPNVGKKIRSKENPLRSGLNPVYVAIANEIGVWLFSDEDDKQMIARGLTVQNMDFETELEDEGYDQCESSTEERDQDSEESSGGSADEDDQMQDDTEEGLVDLV